MNTDDKKRAHRTTVRKTDHNDVVSSIVRAVVGQVPIIGPVLVELVTHSLPNQRLDRIQSFCETISLRLDTAESDLETISKNMEHASGISHFESCLMLALSAQTEQRIEYLASLFVNGVRLSELSPTRNELATKLLAQVSDAEIIVLAAKSELASINEGFKPEHMELMLAVYGDRRVGDDAVALGKAIVNHLESLGLCSDAGATELGLLLLEAIGPIPSVHKMGRDPIRVARSAKKPASPEEVMEIVGQTLKHLKLGL